VHRVPQEISNPQLLTISPGLLDFTPGPINTTTPIIMFCILFGLSMDYEVMLLSRIKEEYERTGDNLSSVTLGIERIGRLITGAALIMATVFFSFGLAEAVVIKAIGLGMGLAVLVDATIIRALLVPATMRLMGRWNWWAPKPLARLHRRLGLSEKPFYVPDPAAPPPYEATTRRGADERKMNRAAKANGVGCIQRTVSGI
ncbi:MAG: MMPL family transporter, partial [Rubrobacter sp.]